MSINFKVIPAPQVYILVIIIIALFLAATNIQSGWLYIIDSLLLSLVFFSLLMPVRQARKLEVVRDYHKTVFEGDQVDITVEVQNKTRRIISFVAVKDLLLKRHSEKPVSFVPEKSDRFFIDISPKDRVTYNYALTPELRGVYRFEKFAVTSYGPFGLFRYTREFASEDRLIVLPNIPVLNASFLSGLRGSGYKYSSQTRHSVDASLPYNVRDYQRGDSIRLIHWRTTARLNKLMVKELETEESFSVQILFDTEKGHNTGNGKESSFEYAVRFAGAIFKLCISRNYKVELIYYDKDRVEVLTEVTPWQQVLDALAYLDTNSRYKVRNILKEKEVDKNSILIPFFMHPKEEDIQLLSELSRENQVVLPVFAEVNSFDKSCFPVKGIIDKSPYRGITLCKGDELSNKYV